MLTDIRAYAQKLNKVIEEHFPYIYKVEDGFKRGFFESPLQRLIMLDRYSLKDFTLSTLTEGDLVVVTIKDDPKYPTRGYGWVVKHTKTHVTVRLDDNFNNGEIITRPRSFIDKPLEIYIEQIARRVARGVAKSEPTPEKVEFWAKKFEELIAKLDLVPAGRIWFGAGNIAKVTWINCFVIPSPRDSRRGILEHAAQTADIMASGGGVGGNMSTLRPIHARVHSVNGYSSGAVSWTHYISQLTHLIQQGGSRRGAQMRALLVTHPEVILFAMCKIQNPDRLRAIAKRFADYPEIAETALSLIHPNDPSRVKDPDFMTGANISVLVTHEFMEAVEKGLDWTFVFPDIDNYTEEEKKVYDEEWHLTAGDVREWVKKISPSTGKPFTLKEYGKIPARVLYDLFMYCAWASAEPGFLFYDNARDMANSYYYAQVIVTNPCAEQWLPPYGTCTLTAVNLANMSLPDGSDVDWERLDEAVSTGIRFLDDVVDASPYPLEEITQMVQNERRIGLGIMGLGDLMIKLKLKYGSPEMLEKLDQIMDRFKNVAYNTSVDLAIEKGPFPLFDADKYLQSGFVKTLNPELRERIRKHGIRNVCTMTVAPTGTTGSMVGVSTGLEPYFAFKFYRSGRLGEFMEVNVAIAQEYFDTHPGETELPDYFVGAQDLTVEEHAEVQAVVQKHVDSACSKTCNAPNSMTVQETKDFYMMAWKKGLKGVTIYRDGSRFEAVLTTGKEITKDENAGDEDDVIVQTGSELKAVLDYIDATTPEFDEYAVESTKVCTIRYENGQRIVECGTE
jgi:ribonucleoside-diphosphate reductase alpha chain